MVHVRKDKVSTPTRVFSAYRRILHHAVIVLGTVSQRLAHYTCINRCCTLGVYDREIDETSSNTYLLNKSAATTLIPIMDSHNAKYD